MVNHKLARLAIYREILAVVLEKIVATKAVGEEVICAVDGGFRWVRGGESAGAATGFGEEEGGGGGVFEAVEHASGEEAVETRGEDPVCVVGMRARGAREAGPRWARADQENI